MNTTKDILNLVESMNERIKFLERRIDLIERVNDYQDKELDNLYNNLEKNIK